MNKNVQLPSFNDLLDKNKHLYMMVFGQFFCVIRSGSTQNTSKILVDSNHQYNMPHNVFP